MKPVLKVFVTENCPGCNETLEIAARIKQEYAGFINVKIIDITDTQTAVPEVVFATPTFMLNDRIVSLGNPGPGQVAEWVIESTTSQPES